MFRRSLPHQWRMRKPAFPEKSGAAFGTDLSDSESGQAKPITIDQHSAGQWRMMEFMRAEKETALLVQCPTCGAKPGEKCELNTGSPRTEPHAARRLATEKE